MDQPPPLPFNKNSLATWLRQPPVVRFVSTACLALAFFFAIAAIIMFTEHAILFMWCNIFWVFFLVASSIGARRIGIQRTLAIGLLLIGLVFLGTGAVWLQLVKSPLLPIINIFWGTVFLAGAYVVDPRRGVQKP
jgi:uncharacterized membrane protein YphA (DoxX/SURF4 family)